VVQFGLCVKLVKREIPGPAGMVVVQFGLFGGIIPKSPRFYDYLRLLFLKHCSTISESF
jgi:hypothetical protein